MGDSIGRWDGDTFVIEFGMKLHPTWKIFEFVCEENNRCEGGQWAESEGQKK